MADKRQHTVECAVSAGHASASRRRGELGPASLVPSCYARLEPITLRVLLAEAACIALRALRSLPLRHSRYSRCSDSGQPA